MTRTEIPVPLRVFISSPGDVPDERAAALRVLGGLNADAILAGRFTLQPCAYERPECGALLNAALPPQHAINETMGRPRDCDLVVVILAGRLGSPLSLDGRQYRSGTEFEYHDALAGWQQTRRRPVVLLYRKARLPALSPVEPSYADRLQQRQYVEQFFAALRNGDGSHSAGYYTFAEVAEFETLFTAHLRTFLRPFVEEPSVQPEATASELPLIDSPQLAVGEQEAWAARLGVAPAWTNATGVQFRLIPPGRFRLGSAPGDRDAARDEDGGTVVRIERPFWMAEFPLTNGLVRDFLSTADGDFARMKLGADRSFAMRTRRDEPADAPAVFVSSADAAELCRWMGEQDGRRYRLPTEAEWEYAARAGATGRFWWDNEPLAVFGRAPTAAPAVRDDRRSNAWGLIDVLGNVEEWTASAYEPPLTGAALRPAGPTASQARVVRGGHRAAPLAQCRLSARRSRNLSARVEQVGVRVVCEIE